MKNILVLTSGYCGKATANGLCAQALVEQLEERGTNVYVISADAEKIACDLNDRVQSVHYTVPPSPISTKFVIKFARQLSKIFKYSLTLKYNKDLLSAFLETAERTIKSEQIDTVISMYFPIESVIAGYQLKKKHKNIEHIIYELDSNGDGLSGIGKWNKPINLRVNVFLKRVYKKADLLMILNCHKEYWMKTFPQFEEKMRLVDLPILIQTQLPAPESSEDGTENFLYSGFLSVTFRSPDVLLKAFMKLDDRFLWNLDFYSRGSEEILNRACEKEKRIKQNGYIEQSLLEEKIANADVLLSIGNVGSNSLPSKIITYMTYGKPIIHFCLQENDICEEYLNKYPLALVIKKSESPEEAAIRIVEFVKETRGKTVDFALLEKTFPMNLPSYSADIILDFLDRKGKD